MFATIRLVHYAACALLAGTFVFWCVVAWPAFRNTQPALALRSAVDRRLFALAWISLLVALASGAAWLLFVGSDMSGLPLGATLQGGVLGVVLTQTHFGIDWIVRGGLFAALAVALVVQTRRRAAGYAGLIVAAALIASLAWAGHGAAADDLPFDQLHLPADILHLLATGAWLGGLVPLAILLMQAARDGSSQAVAVARIATQRFSVVGMTCVGTLVATGIVITWFLVGSVPALIGTLYGQLLLVKIAVFIAIVALAAVNQQRHLACLSGLETEPGVCLQTIRQLGRNASIEAVLGILVLAVVGIIGILPPGAHTEPRWPLPFRFDLSEVPAGTQAIFDIAVVAFAICLVAAVAVAAKKRYGAMAISIALLAIFGVAGYVALRPGIVQAYPTSFYASTQPYAAPSVARGEPLYRQNCIVCHGASGRGDGPLAHTLSIRPADLTEEHLFAHKVGEMFWWISYGKSGVMPGFSDKLTPEERWDLINFLLARAAGVNAKSLGSQISRTTAVPFPDFAFERNGSQNTLSQTLKGGPTLLVLFAGPAPKTRLEQLTRWRTQLAAAGLQIVAVPVTPSRDTTPPVVAVSQDVRTALALFLPVRDGGETELLLDRGGSVRAKWTLLGGGGLADADTLARDATLVASIPAAAANHAGHGQ